MASTLSPARQEALKASLMDLTATLVMETTGGQFPALHIQHQCVATAAPECGDPISACLSQVIWTLFPDELTQMLMSCRRTRVGAYILPGGAVVPKGAIVGTGPSMCLRRKATPSVVTSLFEHLTRHRILPVLGSPEDVLRGVQAYALTPWTLYPFGDEALRSVIKILNPTT